MNKIKFDYEAPEAEAFEVKFEGNLCASPYGEKGNAGGVMDVIDHGEDDDSLY